MTQRIEVDARTIPGNGGSVVLYMGGVDDGYEVHVLDWHGVLIHTLYATTRAGALECFRHPFAVLDVPNMFDAAYEPSLAAV